MSKSTRSDNVDLVPADRQAGAAYDRDFYSWSLEQARLVREGNWDAVVLTDNPGLKPRIAEAIARAYRKARIEAAKETGLDEAVFPETCGYSHDEIVSRALSMP